MEQFDIYDIYGKPTGFISERGMQLKVGQYYLGVHIYIYNSSNDFLLQQRSYDKTFLPGGWDVLLEHVIAGESSKTGAIRGIQEEIGLYLQHYDLHLAGRIVWEIYNHMIDIYFLQADFNINELSINDDEVIGIKTISADEMLSLVSKMDYRTIEYRTMVSSEINKLKTAV